MEKTKHLGLSVVTPNDTDTNVQSWAYKFDSSDASSNMVILDECIHRLRCTKIDADKDTSAEFFEIDYDGLVSLKPEYRGRPGHALDSRNNPETYIYAISDNGLGEDGSKNSELPQTVVIPEVIDGTAVTGFKEGMFYSNFRVAKIVLPPTIKSIPALFCYDAKYLEIVKNTEQVAELGEEAFKNTRIQRAYFPNLRSWGDGVFFNCARLYLADIGDHVETIPASAFRYCESLSLIKGGAKVQSVGSESFRYTVRLRNLPFLSRAPIASVGDYGFATSRINFNWDMLKNCVWGQNPNPTWDNTFDFWSKASFSSCSNPLNTLMNQHHPEWKDIEISNTGYEYNRGCATFSLLHIHSALSGKPYQQPQEFIAELEALGWPSDAFIAQFVFDDADNIVDCNAAVAAKLLGYAANTLCVGNQSITAEHYQEICDKLSFGAYVWLHMGFYYPDSGHAVVLYGMNDIGEVLVADSSSEAANLNLYNEPFTYSVPFQNITGPRSDIVIIEKLDGLTARLGSQSGVIYVDGTDNIVSAHVQNDVLYVAGSFSIQIDDGVRIID